MEQHRPLLQALNQLFGGRANRRVYYRRYLKANGVPRPKFAKISEKRQFELANMLTFLEDMRKVAAKADGQPPEPPKPQGQAL